MKSERIRVLIAFVRAALLTGLKDGFTNEPGTWCPLSVEFPAKPAS